MVTYDFKKFPIEYSLDGKVFKGLPAGGNVITAYNAGVTTLTYSAYNGDLKITAEVILYDNYAVRELRASIENIGKSASGVISDFKLLGTLPEAHPTVIYSNGDDMTINSYKWFSEKIGGGFKISSKDGYSCVGAYPYMRIIGKTYSQNVAIGYGGEWAAEFETKGDKTEYFIRQKTLKTKLYAGEAVVSPRLTVMEFTGGERSGANLWRKFYYDNILLKLNGEPLKPILFLHTFQIGGKSEFCGITDENQILAIDEYIKKGIKPDYWWIDAGWYPCNDNWFNAGSWRADETRLSKNLKAVGDKLKKEKIGLLLWFEIERAVSGSDIEKQHPEWLLNVPDKDGNPSKDNVVNFAASGAKEYFLELLDGIIKDAGVKIYRQDHNTFIARALEKTNVDGRVGITENMHLQGLLWVWDELKKRNSDLIFDECCAGGRRNDLEFMRRAVPLNYTDVAIYDYPVRASHTLTLYDWTPYFRMHAPKTKTAGGKTLPPDDYAYLNTVTPAITDFLEYYDGKEAFETAKKYLPVWRKLASLQQFADFYPLTPLEKITADGFYSVQFDRSTEGYIQAVRFENCPNETLTVYPQVSENKIYEFCDLISGEKFTFCGKDLKNGLTLTIPARSGKLLHYTAK